MKARECTLEIKYSTVKIRKPSRIKKKELIDYVDVTIIYVYEVAPNDGKERVEWILLTNDYIGSALDAFRFVGYYVHRWKIERFHYVLKNGCNIEKLELHNSNKLSKAILLYSIIATKIMNITYLARIHGDTSCDEILDESEWKTLYCIANKTNISPEKAYCIKDTITYLGIIGGYKRSSSDGLPGLEVVWKGLMKLHTITLYQQYLK